MGTSFDDEEGSAEGKDHDPRCSEAVNDARLLSDRLHELLWRDPDRDHAGSESAARTRIVLDVPQEWIVLASWMIRRRLDQEKGIDRGLQHDVSIPPSPVDIGLAKREILRRLYNEFHDDLHWLAIGGHPLLYPEMTEPTPSREGAAPDTSQDDSIPF